MCGLIPNGAGGGGRGGSMSDAAGRASGHGIFMSHDALGAIGLGARGTSMSRGGGGLHGAMPHGAVGGRQGLTSA
jgi:hypothetical protein